MRRAAALCVFAVSVWVAAGCGGGGKSNCIIVVAGSKLCGDDARAWCEQFGDQSDPSTADACAAVEGRPTSTKSLGDLFNNGGATSPISEEQARKRIEKNPSDAGAYQALASALQTDGDLQGAAEALTEFLALRPRDVDALNTLAGLYTAMGQRLQSEITSSQKAHDDAQLTKLYTEQQRDFDRAVEVSKQITALNPKDANAQLSLGQAAQSAGDTGTAIAAYKEFVKLAPDDPTTPLVKQQIKVLQAHK